MILAYLTKTAFLTTSLPKKFNRWRHFEHQFPQKEHHLPTIFHHFIAKP